MGEEEKGLVTLYADGKPVFSASPVEATMELAEVPELPAGGEVMDWNKIVTLERTIDMESRRRGWEPYAGDLIAEDWELAEKLDRKESSADDTERAQEIRRKLNGEFDGELPAVSIRYVP